MPLKSNNTGNTEEKKNINIAKDVPDKEEVLEQGDSYKEDKVSDVIDKIPNSLKSKKAIFIVCGIALFLAVAGIIVTAVNSSEGSDNEFSKYEDSTADDTVEQFKYSEAQRKTLRAYGYTGDEIEEHEANQDDPEGLINSAVEDQKTELRKTYSELKSEMLQNDSPEYKELLDDTWLVGDPYEVKVPEGGIFDTIEKTENIRYKKLPAHGIQCYIKITLDDGRAAFMPVHPDKYVTLKNEGNMVITYKKVVYGDNYYILDIKEKPITSATEGSNKENSINN